MPIFNPPIFAIDQQETLRYAGLHKTDFSQELLEAALLETQLLLAPKSTWELYPYQEDCGTVLTPEPFVLQGEKIKRHLQGSQQVVILSATIGEEIENNITATFKEGKYALAMLMDAAATAAVEQVADYTEKAIFNEIKKQGLQLKTRFSPGYGDWSIEAQPLMLTYSRAESIGLSLTEAYMLMPRKSITAIIGLTATKMDSVTVKNNCHLCQKTNCPARKI